MATSDRSGSAEWVRQHLPTCVAVAAAFREVFPEVRMAYASENGHTLGQRSPDGEVPCVWSIGSGKAERSGR